MCIVLYLQVAKVQIENCRQYTSCTTCLASKDPFCGWCTLENRYALVCPNIVWSSLYNPLDKNNCCASFIMVRCLIMVCDCKYMYQIDKTCNTGLKLKIATKLQQSVLILCAISLYCLSIVVFCTRLLVGFVIMM